MGFALSVAIVLTPDQVVVQRYLWLWRVTQRRVERSEVLLVDIVLEGEEHGSSAQGSRDLENTSVCIGKQGYRAGVRGKEVKFGHWLTIEEKKWVLLEIAHYLRVPVGAGFFRLFSSVSFNGGHIRSERDPDEIWGAIPVTSRIDVV